MGIYVPMLVLRTNRIPKAVAETLNNAAVQSSFHRCAVLNDRGEPGEPVALRGQLVRVPRSRSAALHHTPSVSLRRLLCGSNGTMELIILTWGSACVSEP